MENQQSRESYPLSGAGASQQMQPALTQYVPVPIMQSQTQQRGQQLNNLYKTALCKHFSQHKHCVKGNGCHFAHGDAELRRKDEQLPMEVQYKMLNIPYNNYKTQVCKYFEQDKQCHFGKNCTYAHGKDEMRKPYEELPVDVGEGGLDVTNPNAFRLLKAQVQAFQPRFILNNKDQVLKDQIVEIGNLFKTQRDEQGYKILQTLLQNNQISAQYAVSLQNSASQAQTQQPLKQNNFPNLSPQPAAQTVPLQQNSTPASLNNPNAFMPLGAQATAAQQIPAFSNLGTQQAPSNGQVNFGAPAAGNLPQNAASSMMQQQQLIEQLQASNPQLLAAAINQNQFLLQNGSLPQQPSHEQAQPQVQMPWLPQLNNMQQQQQQFTTQAATPGTTTDANSIFVNDIQSVKDPAHQGNAYGQGFLYTPIPGQVSAADQAQWNMRE